MKQAKKILRSFNCVPGAVLWNGKTTMTDMAETFKVFAIWKADHQAEQGACPVRWARAMHSGSPELGGEGVSRKNEPKAGCAELCF